MEYDYDDIQAYIDRANKMRSEAMGELLSVGWKHCVEFFKSLTHFPSHTPVFIRKA